MQFSTNDAGQICTKLVLQRVPCTHHVRAYLEVGGKIILTVHYSFGRKDIPEHIAHKFRRQLRLSTNEFDEMRRCRIGRKEYLELLRKKAVI